MTCDIIKETSASNEFVWDLPRMDRDPLVVWFSVYAKSNAYIALADRFAPGEDVNMYVVGK